MGIQTGGAEVLPVCAKARALASRAAVNFRHAYRASLLLSVLAVCAAAADPAPEFQLKSAFVYHFATFIDWHEESGKPLALCVAAPQEEMKYFSVLEGKPLGNTTVAVRHLDKGASAAGCRILFVAEAESDGFDAWLPELRGKQALTLSESGNWLEKGAMVGLLRQEDRISFDVNVAAARDAGVVINSKLLRLAHKVYGLEPADEPAQHSAK